MKVADKSREPVAEELAVLHRRIAELEKLEAERRRAEEQLRKYREHLEELVEERTAELTTTNEQLQQEITKCKQAEEELRESEERYHNLVKEINDGIFITDDRGSITFANKALAEIHGFESPEGLVGRTFIEFIAPEMRDEIAKEFREGIKTGKLPEASEVPIIRRDGSVAFIQVKPVPIIKEGRVVGAGGVVRDITKRKQAEEELRESEERYRSLLELGGQIGEAVVMLQDTAQGEAIQTFVSDEWSRITGYSREELLGRPFFSFVHPKHWAASEDRHRRRMAGESIPGLFEISIVKKDNTEVPIELTSAYTTYKGERANVVYIRDITARKWMEEQLITADRLASIGVLASGVAHELNNPLTGIIGFSELLLEKDVPDDIKEDLAIIHHEALRTAEVIKNLLAFGRKRAPLRQPVNVNSVIARVLGLRAYEQKVSNIHIDTRFAHDLPQAMADSFQMQQVFLNIVINAEYFMAEAHKGGTLTITTERVGDMVRASFADDGPGISGESLGHLFDPFFTTKEVGKGTGLGLSICHGTVTEHGGRIYAESELGKGATFVVELPLTDADEEEVAK